jgi:galactose-1-phosphate uridylyltransferase
VPDFVREEIDGARRHFASKERCVFCDIIRRSCAAARVDPRERRHRGARAVRAAVSVRDVAAAAAHGARFEEAPRHEYESLARMLKTVLQRMNRRSSRRRTT